MQRTGSNYFKKIYIKNNYTETPPQSKVSSLCPASEYMWGYFTHKNWLSSVLVSAREGEQGGETDQLHHGSAAQRLSGSSCKGQWRCDSNCWPATLMDRCGNVQRNDGLCKLVDRWGKGQRRWRVSWVMSRRIDAQVKIQYRYSTQGPANDQVW